MSNTIEEQTPEPGDIIFTKRIRLSVGSTGGEWSFKGHAFGILLGSVPPLAQDPQVEWVFQKIVLTLGPKGFILLDDVAEFLGDEQAQACAEKWGKKYEQAQLDDIRAMTEASKPKSPILDAAGSPLKLVETPNDPVN